jgi:threonine/homoserine/homoserine lactone efflux protein
MIVALLGLTALLQASALGYQILKTLGVAYLLYMPWTIVHDKEAFAVREYSAPRSPARIVVSGILVNVVNPKLTIFFVAFLPQILIPYDPEAYPHMLES